MTFVIPQAGATPAVFFTPVKFVVTGVPTAMVADPIDPTTGELLSIERGFDSVDAAVITALRTVRDSGSAVEDVGQRFADAKLVTPALEGFLREEARLALDHLTSTKQISLEDVTVATEDDTAGVFIVYRNIPADKERRAFLPLGSLMGRAVA